MAWVIAVLGAVLAVGGGISLWNGTGYLRLDWGQAEMVAGTVALSGGIVTLALAAVLWTLRDLARRPVRAATSGVGLEAVNLTDEADVPAASTARGRLVSRLATVGLPKTDRREPQAPTPVAAQDLDAPFAEAQALQDPAPGTPIFDAPEPVLDVRPHAVAEAPRPAAAGPAEAPTVVGRYEANGASYVLFSDGTIEVETDGGTHRFASMAALKDHIERQDAT